MFLRVPSVYRSKKCLAVPLKMVSAKWSGGIENPLLDIALPWTMTNESCLGLTLGFNRSLLTIEGNGV